MQHICLHTRPAKPFAISCVSSKACWALWDICCQAICALEYLGLCPPTLAQPWWLRAPTDHSYPSYLMQATLLYIHTARAIPNANSTCTMLAWPIFYPNFETPHLVYLVLWSLFCMAWFKWGPVPRVLPIRVKEPIRNAHPLAHVPVPALRAPSACCTVVTQAGSCLMVLCPTKGSQASPTQWNLPKQRMLHTVLHLSSWTAPAAVAWSLLAWEQLFAPFSHEKRHCNQGDEIVLWNVNYTYCSRLVSSIEPIRDVLSLKQTSLTCPWSMFSIYTEYHSRLTGPSGNSLLKWAVLPRQKSCDLWWNSVG